LGYTRAIIDAIYSGELDSFDTTLDSIFRANTITSCLQVPSELLIPKSTWKDGAEFEKIARNLAGLFTDNVGKYADGVSESVRNAGPIT